MKIVQAIKTTISNNLGELVKESEWFKQVNHQIITLEDQNEDFQEILKELQAKSKYEEELWDIQDDVEELKDKVSNFVSEDDLSEFAEDSRVDDIEDSVKENEYEIEKLEGRVTDIEDNYQEMRDKINELTKIIQKMQKQLNNQKENENE